MTHVLDEAIADLRWSIAEDMERRHRHGRHTRLTLHRVVRSHIALLRLACAERAESRDDHVYRAVMAERERQQRLSAEREGTREAHTDPPPKTLDELRERLPSLTGLSKHEVQASKDGAVTVQFNFSRCGPRDIVGSLSMARLWHAIGAMTEVGLTTSGAYQRSDAYEPTPAEQRAEGRREERERVVAWLRDQSERLANERMARPPYIEAREEDAVADGLLWGIERGDHWRGGEG